MERKIEFVKLEVGKTINGLIEGFGKNKYGVFLIIKTIKKTVAINCNATVLKNLIKANISLFVKGSKISITKLDKPKGKTYFDYEVILNDKLLESRSFNIDIDEVANLL